MSNFGDALELEKARKLFRRFQYREPKRDELILVGGLEKPVPALGVGIAIGISYKAFGDGKEYLHWFEGNRPKIFVNADGSQLYFVGGDYRFTDRGFIK